VFCMDLENPVVKLCIEGTRAEFEGRQADACVLYGRAWETAKDDFEACIAAHYVARCQENPEGIFDWNQKALIHAEKIRDGSVKEFYPSLYLNMGRSYELLGNDSEARRYYDLAAELGYFHQAE
jgi:hypothetical protein